MAAYRAILVIVTLLACYGACASGEEPQAPKEKTPEVPDDPLCDEGVLSVDEDHAPKHLTKAGCKKGGKLKEANSDVLASLNASFAPLSNTTKLTAFSTRNDPRANASTVWGERHNEKSAQRVPCDAFTGHKPAVSPFKPPFPAPTCGARDVYVRVLQMLLKENGANIKVTGIYDDETDKRLYQRMEGKQYQDWAQTWTSLTAMFAGIDPRTSKVLRPIVHLLANAHQDVATEEHVPVDGTKGTEKLLAKLGIVPKDGKLTLCSKDWEKLLSPH